MKTWTRHVDIFKKDFLFVPVNQEYVKLSTSSTVLSLYAFIHYISYDSLEHIGI